MDIRGVSGRSAVWYGVDPASVINGLRFEDPTPIPEYGWNRREWVMTPFGFRVFTGAMSSLLDEEEND